ncbi:MAG: type II secretion system protein GspJ [Candidatus Obscuribacterales bacterium]|nr:type II secretion system protein GspJ [Candidatus Obscuribacterales bacterium]
MTENDGSISFYFFDIDDNLFFLPTKLYLWNAETQTEREVSSGDYTYIHDQLGRVGEWQAWSVREGFTYRDFRDAPDVAPQEQAFCKVLLEAVTSGMQWQGPSWPLLEHAARKQRPVVFITARGHAPETIAAGFDALADKGILASRLNILCIYTVSNPEVQKSLGVTDPNTTVPSMKKMAIKAAVEIGLEKYGRTPPHRFGISDDDPNNVMLAINAMRDCKVKYQDKRFFVINTNKDHYVKLEVFPMDHPVTADATGKTLLSSTESSE